VFISPGYLLAQASQGCSPLLAGELSARIKLEKPVSLIPPYGYSIMSSYISIKF